MVLALLAERLDGGLSAQPNAACSGFMLLDERVQTRDAHGVLRVTSAEAGFEAISAHVERRAEAIGRRVVRADLHAESPWRDAALRLGLANLPHDVDAAADLLVSAASGVSAVLLVALGSESAWDDAIASAVADRRGGALFIILMPRALPGSTLDVLDIPAELDGAALARWWEAVAAARSRAAHSKLSDLNAWMDGAERGEGRQPEELLAELPASARELFACLSLAHRAWPVSGVAELGAAADLELLIRRGLVSVRDELISVARIPNPSAAPRELAERVAAAMARLFPRDALGFARSAELWAGLGQLGPAESAMHSALNSVDDGAFRASLWARFGALLDTAPETAASDARLRGAELALELGDADVGLAWAQRIGCAEQPARAAFVLGRAALARGDLVSAFAALERARDLSDDDEAKWAASVQIGEVRYAAGELTEAAEIAQCVQSSAQTASVRLAARNLLGKLLLARGEWATADAHFAADECEAIGNGDSTAELRARVNRAIALLSRGASEPARAMLAQVLSDAEARGERRAVGFALSNLAVLAIERHDYGHALELLERTIAAHRRVGDRLNFARDISNIVELRLRLGLLEQAEQALRFGRHALGPGAPGSRAAEIALASAQVHLALRRTPEAERDVRSALRSAAMSSDGDKLGECHRVAARVALDDGAVGRAEVEIGRARALAATPYDHAEVALLEALSLRAQGRPARAAAEHAVAATHEAGDEELARQAHVLSAEIALSEADDLAAQTHLAAARALVDDVLRSLSGHVREAYLARPALMHLARLERAVVDAPESESEPVSLRLPSQAPRQAAGEIVYVGKHPSVRALLDSLGRVGPSDATVLIHGESGTGKELISELIHGHSQRARGPLVRVNCAALVESLLLSELFGHEKGAFTGASSRRRGRFERANGGTLFLDEIGDISPRTQVALLRVLEERRIERVGGSAPIAVDVRIVCATHRDLRTLVERGQFREDLYYRLSGINLEVPSLRERLSDLPLLCDAILERIARERGEAAKSLTREAIELLGRHRWPGNVRELENALRAVSVLSEREVLDVQDFVEHVEALRKLALEPQSVRRDSTALRAAAPGGSSSSAGVPVTEVAYREIRQGSTSLSDLKRNIERECIERALEDAGGNITRAATLLGMKRPRLSQLVKQYGFLVNGTEDPS